MTLLLVRHGQSEGNAARVIQGGLDPLSGLGRTQADAVAARLASSGATRLYASTFARARDTATPIAAATGLELEPLGEWREYWWGEAQGRTWPDAVAAWGSGDPPALEWGSGDVPGEEGEAAFAARVTEAFDLLLERHEDDLGIVVTHGGVLVQIVKHVFGVEGYRPVGTPANTSVSTFALDRGVAVIEALNDTCHLRDLPSSASPAL